MIEIGFGGGCHWCTEAVFQSLIGVSDVRQGWIASDGDAASFSEAVLLKFDPGIISLEILVAIHLHTHSCTADHSMREKYRSAVYTFSAQQTEDVKQILLLLQKDFKDVIITKVLPMVSFRLNKEQDLNYYYNDREKPFCKTYIDPKIRLLMRRFSKQLKPSSQQL